MVLLYVTDGSSCVNAIATLVFCLVNCAKDVILVLVGIQVEDISHVGSKVGQTNLQAVFLIVEGINEVHNELHDLSEVVPTQVDRSIHQKHNVSCSDLNSFSGLFITRRWWFYDAPSKPGNELLLNIRKVGEGLHFKDIFRGCSNLTELCCIGSTSTNANAAHACSLQDGTFTGHIRG